jgi:hypothetical protein
MLNRNTLVFEARALSRALRWSKYKKLQAIIMLGVAKINAPFFDKRLTIFDVLC